MTAPALATCTLQIGGMTCASCVRHVEKALARVDGVGAAEVNLATVAATVGYDPARVAELAGLKRKWQAALATGLGLMVLMYIPLPIDAMDWLMPALLVVATVVQFWAGRPFYSAALAAARHGSTNMNTLIALGTLVAYGYSAFVTLWPAAAEWWGLPLHALPVDVRNYGTTGKRPRAPSREAGLGNGRSSRRLHPRAISPGEPGSDGSL